MKKFNIKTEDIIGCDALFDSMMKCKNGVRWKPSTKSFEINAVQNIQKMHDQLVNGEWKNGRPKPIQIKYPKKRDGLSISFPDRVYQRSINDNALYPAVVPSFIIDNCACQKGKGPDFARERLDKKLWNIFCHSGTDFYVLQIDIKGYYPNMRHDIVKEKFSRYLDNDIWQMVCDVLDTQYIGDVGYNPGSQMVQIAGIALLDDLDHYCKERLHAKYFMRYMDDIIILHEDKEALEQMLDEITKQLALIGLQPHETKTHIVHMSKGFRFLGFDYRMTQTGKIIKTLNSENVKHERKKLRRMVHLARKGIITKEKVDECFQSWCNHASKGNSHKLIKRMEKYYHDLWEEKIYEDN